ncbi:MAG: hypothetical protein QOD94_2103 [Alphaproteobacteria bacterium]|jgi:hypothetical protein|nr:hypothetical protein [Alphaproteobacteria bacterium]
MHGRKILLSDGTSATLSIHRDVRDNLANFAVSEIPNYRGRGKSLLGTWIFETTLPVAQYCEPNDALPDRGAFVGDFELGSDTRLRRTI